MLSYYEEDRLLKRRMIAHKAFELSKLGKTLENFEENLQGISLQNH